ncbi:MAG: 30S ribosomal protein THX [Rhodanobacteraceae bacterium]
MGKGDRKTRKGKIYRGSHGNVRPHSPKSKAAVKKTVSPAKPAARPAARPATRPAVKKAPAKRAPAKKTS